MFEQPLPRWLAWAADPDQLRRAPFLAGSPLFTGLPRRLLARLATRFFEKVYHPGETVFEEGDPGRALFVVVEGAVEITRATPQGPYVLNTLGPGDAFGELALIDDFPRSATARVATPGRLLILYKSDFDALMEGNSRIALVVLRNLSRRLAIYARRKPVVATEPDGAGEGGPAVKPGRLLAWGGLAALAWLARGLVLPLFLAAALAYLLTPAVAWADALAIRRSVAVSALFAVIIAVLATAGFLLGPGMLAEGGALVERMPALARQIDVGLDAVVRELAESAPALRRLLPEGGGWVQRFVLNRGPSEPGDLFEHVGHLFLLAILIPFFAFFLLRDMHRLIAVAMDRLPRSTWRPRSRCGASSTGSSGATSAASCWTASWWARWRPWACGRRASPIPSCSAHSPVSRTWCRSWGRCSRPRPRGSWW